MRYRTVTSKALILILRWAIIVLSLIWGGVTVVGIFCQEYLAAICPFIGLFLVFFALLMEEIAVRTIEFYDDKIVFVHRILRWKKETVPFTEIERIKVAEALAVYGESFRTIRKGIIHHYVFDIKGRKKSFFDPYCMDGIPSNDKIVEEFLRGRIPIEPGTFS